MRRAGWFSAQQLGAYLLEQARWHGVRTIQGRVTGIQVAAKQVRSVILDSGAEIQTDTFVNAAGPYLHPVGRLLGLDLPVVNELHLKVALHDTLTAVPRHAPLLIWNDPQSLPWSAEERLALANSDETRWLLGEMPPGAHTRPEGGPDSDIILLLWEYRFHPAEPVFPPPLDSAYPEIALRGLAAMLPRMGDYFQRLPRPVLDGGYYTKTRENRPLIGPLPVRGRVRDRGIERLRADGLLRRRRAARSPPHRQLAAGLRPGFRPGALCRSQLSRPSGAVGRLGSVIIREILGITVLEDCHL